MPYVVDSRTGLVDYDDMERRARMFMPKLLIAGGRARSPFDYADVVTTTTHKTLRGPRSGMIFGRAEHMEGINSAVFPMLQGGPHNHQIGALAVALKEAASPKFERYARMVVENARALGEGLIERGHHLVTGGTD